MDDSWGSRASRHPPPRRAPAPDAPAIDWSPAYQSPYDEQPEWPHHQQQQQHHHQQPSYYASLFSAYRDDPATTNPPSPTSPNTHGYRPRDFATTASASTFSSPGGSWEQWPPEAGPAALTWNALQNELSMLQQFVPNDVPPPPPTTVPFYGMRTPPPTGRVPSGQGAFPVQSHDSSPQFWTQPYSMPGGGGGLAIQPNSLEQALPQPLQQRTRYSVSGVILDEEDFLDYATSSLDWLDSAAVSVAADQTTRAQQQQVLSTSSLPRLDLNYPISETKPVSPTMYMQLLSPLEPTRPASAPPEKSRRPRPSTAAAATGHSGAIEQEDGDVFYQITNRRRSSSVDATMARAAAASSITTADPLPVDERSSSYSRPPPHPHHQHRASMRGWVHYERRSSMASLDDPNPSSAAYLSSVPYPPPRPGTPTRPSAARQGRRASAAAASSSSSSSRRPSAAITESGSPTTSPSRSGGGGRHHRPSSLSFVNFSSADAPKLMKAVSKSGGVAKHKRGPPPESRKGDHPHLK